MVYLLG